MSEPLPKEPNGALSVSLGRGVAESLLLVALTLAILLPGLGRSAYVKTEGLRVVVAKEMLETGNYLVPHVHHAPYTRKPPLFAWQLAALSKLTGTELNETLARSLSVSAAVLYVLVVYWGAVFLFRRRCGLLAATMALCTWNVLDYGSRAELDLTFTAWVTAMQLCLYAAIRRTGGMRWLAWTGVYATAAVATLAKGPHAVIFLGLTMLGWCAVQAGAGALFTGKPRLGWIGVCFSRAFWGPTIRELGRLLIRPAHLVPALTSFVIVVGWAVHMSTSVGHVEYGYSAAGELFMRLVPWQPKHFLGWLWGVPVFAIITLPASVPALAWLLWPVRSPDGERERTAVLFLLVWVLSNLVFLTFAPAKASRYMLPVFAPVALLGAYAWRLYLDHALPRRWDLAIRRYAGVVFGVGGVVAIAGIVAAIQWRRTGRYFAWPLESADTALLVAAAGMGVLAALAGLVRVVRNGRLGQWALIVLVLILTRPMYLEVIVPLREARYGHRVIARTVDEHVPPGQPVLVFGKVPMPDMEIYSQRDFVWSGWQDPNEGRELVGDGPAYFLMYERKDWERFKERLRFAILDRLRMPLGEEPYVLVTVDFSRSAESAELAADR